MSKFNFEDSRGSTSPATGTPAIIAPSGGVRRGVPKGNEAPQRRPIVRSPTGLVPSDKTMSIYARVLTRTPLISSKELNVSRTSSQSFLQVRSFVRSSFRRWVKVFPVVVDPTPLRISDSVRWDTAVVLH
jgi:hypothetical protein